MSRSRRCQTAVRAYSRPATPAKPRRADLDWSWNARPRNGLLPSASATLADSRFTVGHRGGRRWVDLVKVEPGRHASINKSGGFHAVIFAAVVTGLASLQRDEMTGGRLKEVKDPPTAAQCYTPRSYVSTGTRLLPSRCQTLPVHHPDLRGPDGFRQLLRLR